MLFAGPKLDIPKLRQYFSVDRILTVTPPVLCAESQTARETIIRKASIVTQGSVDAGILS